MDYPQLRTWSQILPRAQSLQYAGAVPMIGDLYPPMLSWHQGVAAGPEYDFPNPGPLNGQMIYPAHGIPPRRGEDRAGLSPWGRLCRGQPLGKKSVLLYDANDTRKQSATVPILKVEGDDMDAQSVVVTLLPPLVIPLAFAPQLFLHQGVQNLTAEQSNLENTGNFPGSSPPAPVTWPPFEAIIEWGVGGASARASVDFVNGATVPNLVASWIRVHAAVPRDNPIVGTSAAYVLYAFVGPGPGVGSAQKTTWVGDLDAGAESAAFPVPRFARRSYVVGASEAGNPPPTNAVLRFWQDANKAHNVGNFVMAGGQPLPFDVPAGAMFASVLSSMNQSTRFGIVYNLAI
jgi:hypothetical protein